MGGILSRDPLRAELARLLALEQAMRHLRARPSLNRVNGQLVPVRPQPRIVPAPWIGVRG